MRNKGKEINWINTFQIGYKWVRLRILRIKGCTKLICPMLHHSLRIDNNRLATEQDSVIGSSHNLDLLVRPGDK